jgi:hypothetical protein
MQAQLLNILKLCEPQIYFQRPPNFQLSHISCQKITIQNFGVGFHIHFLQHMLIYSEKIFDRQLQQTPNHFNTV